MKKNNILLLVVTFLIITGTFISVMDIKFDGLLYFLNPLFYDKNNLISIFFILIGFYIYNYFHANSRNAYYDFFRKILINILPIYFIFILAVSVINNCFNFNYILPHAFFINGLFPDLISVNDSSWIINIIFQFSIVSYIMFVAVEKHPKVTYIVCLIISILGRFFLYHFALPNSNYSQFVYFEIYGRQLFTTLDIFALGMLLGKYKTKVSMIPNSKLLLLINVIALYGLSYYSYSRYGSYNSIFGYIYASLFAILLMTLIINYYRKFKKINFNKDSMIVKYETCLLLFDGTILYLVNDKLKFENNLMMFLIYFISINILSLVLAFGIQFISHKFGKLFGHLIKEVEKLVPVLLSIFTFAVLITCIPRLRIFMNRDIEAINNIKSGNIIRDDKLDIVVNDIEKVINNERYTYLYVSEPEYQGFLNYYMMVYYLAINKSVDVYHNYIPIMYFGTEKEKTEYICSVKPDYVIFHDYLLLEKDLIDKNENNLYIYSVDSSHCTTLNNTLIPINGGDLK